jgi:long-chain fatty acid transport protein
MKIVKSRMYIILSALMLTAFMSGKVEATNGYFSHGYGTQTKSMAGAGAAFPLNSIAAATNPAGMVHLGKRFDISIALFSPNREYTITGDPSGMGFGLTPGTVESESKLFAIPALGANFMLDGFSSLGISIYGNGGMNTNYPTKSYDSPMATVTQPTGVNLAQLFVNVSYSRMINPQHSLGISGIFAYQMFKAEGLQAFGGLSSDATKLTNNDHDNAIGFGARLGYLGRILPMLSIGGSFQTKIYMSEFEDYAGLFAEQGDFDIPANWTAGIAVEANPQLTFVADIQQILYSGIKAVSNPMDPNTLNPAMNPDGFIPLGSDEAAGFGWEDVTVFKLGAQWRGIPNMPLRAGYSYCGQPIPESEMMFNILAPGVVEHHLTFGFSRFLPDGKEISFTVMHALSSSVSGPNTMEIPDQQEIELKMNQWEFEIGLGF